VIQATSKITEFKKNPAMEAHPKEWCLWDKNRAMIGEQPLAPYFSHGMSIEHQNGLNLMKRIILILISVIGAVRLASASDIFSYTATGSPGNTPDGVDQSNNPVNVWGLILTPGGTNDNNDSGADGEGVYYGNPDGSGGIGGSSGNSWQEYSYQNDGVGLGGSVDATNQFSGGALTVGQTVSINFVMRATDPATDGLPPGEVGVSLLNGSSDAITFYIYGGGPGYYLYTDAGSTAADAGPMTYQYQTAFNIAFTVPGPNTYTAVAGSDSWSGTFNGSLTGIDVFNHAGGNGSDVGFNNLTVAPELAINNIFPNDNTVLFNVTNTLGFSIDSPASPVNASGIQLTLNGVNVSSNLVIQGAGTDNPSVAYTNLLLNHVYVGQISVSNELGAIETAAVRFDTFNSNFFTWEAEDFDFNGGQFINNPVLSTNSPDSYYNQVGVTNIDEYVPNYDPTQPHLWRTNDEVSTALAQDTPRAQFTASGIPDYLVGYFDPGNWLNYTRTFPAGTYNIYGRLANGNSGLANCTLAEVTSGEGTSNQVVAQLGTFQFTSRGWNNFDFIPLTDAWGNLLAVKLNGQTTLKVTSGQLGGGVNLNFFMLAPGSNTPPAIANIYPDGLQPFETTNSLTFTVSSALSTVSQNNVQVMLNGANVSSQLVFNGSTTNWAVTLPLSMQAFYTATITATDGAGNSNSYTESFDNFTQSNLMIEADEYDFNGGQFIDNSIQTATNYTATNSYYPWPDFPEDVSDNVAVYGVDYTTANTNVGELFVYRYDDAAGTQPTTDFLRYKFTNSGQDNAAGEPLGYTNSDFNIGWWNTGTWLNYTRTFPTNNYYVYGRLAGGVPYNGGVTLSLVTAGQGTTSQTTQSLGSFSDPNANGFQTWDWVPLMNSGTNVAVSLAGVETLKATAGPASSGGNVNSHFFMFVPAVSILSVFPLNTSVAGNLISIKFQTQNSYSYTVLYSSSLNPVNWQTLTTVNGDGTVKTVMDTISGSQRYYRVEAQ
jgi:hypothetical protein